MKQTRLPFVLIGLVALAGLTVGCNSAFMPTQPDGVADQLNEEPAGITKSTDNNPADSVQWDGEPWVEPPADSVQWDGDPWDGDVPDQPDTAYHDPEPWVPVLPDTI